MILDMSTKDMVPLSEEIRALTLYLELEQLRFDDKLMYEFVVDTSISTETTYIHSMLIQPYVENAIKHGLLHKKDNWKLLLKFSKKGNAIEITVDDNGIGRQKSEELNKLKLRRHQSFATNANQTRLEILNKGLKNSIALHIVDKVDDRGQPAGTTVVLTIPLLS
jgi:LytS/YehU family sensor histidine kinase